MNNHNENLTNEVLRLNALIQELSQKVEILQGKFVSSRRLIGVSYNNVEGYNTGDTAWMLAATALVLMMTLPGLSLYYAGMSSRKHNMMTTAMHAFSTAGLITLMWMFFGYSLTFSVGSKVIGGASNFWLYSLNPYGSYNTIPETLHCAFQLAFAIVAAALTLGASGDRMRYLPMLVFICLWHLLVYCPIAHSSWAPGGFLLEAGVLDYAGGNVVHISAGMSGLASSYVLGKRGSHHGKKHVPQNILYTIAGACLLWIGWCGFNAGSSYGANGQAGLAMLTTQIATAAASLSWMMMDYFMSKQLTVLGLLCGAIAGLVAVTPCAGYVDQTGAFFTGLLAGPVCYMGITLKHKLGFDDALDAFGLHGIAGVYGGIMTGFFAKNFDTQGAFYGNGEQLALQIYGVVVCSLYSFCVTLAILLIMDMTWGIRLSERAEKQGLDRAHHGEGLYVEQSDEATPEQRVADLLKAYAEATNIPVPEFLGKFVFSNFGDDDNKDGGGDDDEDDDDLGSKTKARDLESPGSSGHANSGHDFGTGPGTGTANGGGSSTVRKLPTMHQVDSLEAREQLAALLTLVNKNSNGSRRSSGTGTGNDVNDTIPLPPPPPLSKKGSTANENNSGKGAGLEPDYFSSSTDSRSPRRFSNSSPGSRSPACCGSPNRFLSKKKSVSFSVEDAAAATGEGGCLSKVVVQQYTVTSTAAAVAAAAVDAAITAAEAAEASLSVGVDSNGNVDPLHSGSDPVESALGSALDLADERWKKQQINSHHHGNPIIGRNTSGIADREFSTPVQAITVEKEEASHQVGQTTTAIAAVGAGVADVEVLSIWAAAGLGGGSGTSCSTGDGTMLLPEMDHGSSQGSMTSDEPLSCD